MGGCNRHFQVLILNSPAAGTTCRVFRYFGSTGKGNYTSSRKQRQKTKDAREASLSWMSIRQVPVIRCELCFVVVVVGAV
jgi:hypothetical protein